MMSFLALISAAIVGTASFLLILTFHATDPTFPVIIALKKYLLSRYMLWRGYWVSRRVERATKDIGTSQEEVLQEILATNRDTSYFRDHGLKDATGREEYRKIHSLSKHDQFAPYVSRMMEGEKKVLTANEPFFYALSSGTTGQPVVVPQVPRNRKNLIDYTAYCTYTMRKEVLAYQSLQRRMVLYFRRDGPTELTASGKRIGPVSTAYGFSDEEAFTTPVGANNIADEPSARYVHLLFGLRYRKLVQIDAIFATIVYTCFQDLEKRSKDFIKDIRYGTLNPSLKISPECRNLLEAKLFPDPERADELETEFAKGFHKIIRRIWPRLRTIFCITTGVFAHCAKIVRDRYLDDDIQMFTSYYLATEGVFGLNMWPYRSDPAVFLLWPNDIFYEFIDMEHVTQRNPPTVFADQVEVGREYEIVITTFSGLYRYRLGDIIRVIEFYNTCPIMQITGRTGQMLNIVGEKVSDASLYDAITQTAKTFPEITGIVDFTSCESILLDESWKSSQPSNPSGTSKAPNYVIFLEFDTSKNIDGDLLQNELAEKIDLKLMDLHGGYQTWRPTHLSQLEVVIVPTGAFRRFRDFILANSTASPSQVKIPRILRKPEQIQFMSCEARTVGM